MTQQTVSKRYLTPRDAAAYLGMGLSTLSIHRMRGTGPQFIKWLTNIRYEINDLDAWMSERRVTPAPRPMTEKRRVGRPRKIKGQEASAQGQ